MYLTFDRKTKELLSTSDIPTYESNVNQNVFNIIYFDDYVIMQNREDVNYVETRFDEVMGIEALIPGQFILPEDVLSFCNLKKIRTDILDKAFDKADNKIKEVMGFIPLSYFLFMVNSDNRFYDTLMTVQHNITGVEKDLIREMNMDRFEKVLKKINIIDANYNKLKKTIDETDIVEDIEGALITFNYTLDNLI